MGCCSHHRQLHRWPKKVARSIATQGAGSHSRTRVDRARPSNGRRCRAGTDPGSRGCEGSPCILRCTAKAWAACQTRSALPGLDRGTVPTAASRFPICEPVGSKSDHAARGMRECRWDAPGRHPEPPSLSRSEAGALLHESVDRRDRLHTLGSSDPAYFTRSFTNHAGCSPSASGSITRSAGWRD
jgi:hypothetical protein